MPHQNEERLVTILEKLPEQAFPMVAQRDSLAMIEGLTKREYISSQILSGLLMAYQPTDRKQKIVKDAVTFADMLLAELGEKK